MAFEGMLTEALAICRAVHERYHPSKCNPWNEIECGDHYQLARASRGVLVAMAGFSYDGPTGWIGFAPRFNPDNFRSIYTAAEGWGSYTQRRDDQRQASEISVVWGQVRLRGVSVETGNSAPVRVDVTLAGRRLPVQTSREGSTLRLDLGASQRLQAGEKLTIELDPA